MAAAPFKAILKFKTANGGAFTYPCTVSDVNNEYYVFPDSSTDVVLPSNMGNIFLTDVVLSAAGTDTSQAKIFVNGKDTGDRILNASNLGTNFSRQFMNGHPLGIAPASRLKIQQNT